MRYLRYLWSVTRHRWFVMIECFKVGLIWRGLVHDWSKFLPDEFIPYANTFYGPDGYTETPEFAFAWNKHQKRHDHHYQFWLLTWDRGNTELLPMSSKARLEMLCDWNGAGRAYKGKDADTAAWYKEHREKIHLHPETRVWIEMKLGI